MGKVYIVYYDWANTRGNHAGMAYLAKQIEKHHTSKVQLIKHAFRFDLSYPGRKLYQLYAPVYSFLIALYLVFRLKSTDKVFFLEYCGAFSGSEQFIAKILRKFGVKNEFYGLIHQPESLLKQVFTLQVLDAHLKLIDKVVVFGSSLKQYLSTFMPSDKIIQTYHYVDTQFYQPRVNYLSTMELKVIIMGNQMRSDLILRDIIEQCPQAEFHICMGVRKDVSKFQGLKNVFCYGFLSENEFLTLMQQSDVSLSIMADTEGSNVIVTSLACGLAMVVSDVGSIRDYCTEKNSLFCNNTAPSFTSAIQQLIADKKQIESMKLHSKLASQEISLEKFVSEAFPLMVDFK